MVIDNLIAILVVAGIGIVALIRALNKSGSDRDTKREIEHKVTDAKAEARQNELERELEELKKKYNNPELKNMTPEEIEEYWNVKRNQ